MKAFLCTHVTKPLIQNGKILESRLDRHHLIYSSKTLISYYSCGCEWCKKKSLSKIMKISGELIMPARALDSMNTFSGPLVRGSGVLSLRSSSSTQGSNYIEVTMHNMLRISFYIVKVTFAESNCSLKPLYSCCFLYLDWVAKTLKLLSNIINFVRVHRPHPQT